MSASQIARQFEGSMRLLQYRNGVFHSIRPGLRTMYCDLKGQQPRTTLIVGATVEQHVDTPANH